MMAAYSHTCRTPRGLVTATTPRAQDTDGGGLGVAAIAEAVAEAGAERDDVLHRACSQLRVREHTPVATARAERALSRSRTARLISANLG